MYGCAQYMLLPQLHVVHDAAKCQALSIKSFEPRDVKTILGSHRPSLLCVHVGSGVKTQSLFNAVCLLSLVRQLLDNTKT